jgi:hypothetical protein
MAPLVLRRCKAGAPPVSANGEPRRTRFRACFICMRPIRRELLWLFVRGSRDIRLCERCANLGELRKRLRVGQWECSPPAYAFAEHPLSDLT